MAENKSTAPHPFDNLSFREIAGSQNFAAFATYRRDRAADFAFKRANPNEKQRPQPTPAKPAAMPEAASDRMAQHLDRRLDALDLVDRAAAALEAGEDPELAERIYQIERSQLAQEAKRSGATATKATAEPAHPFDDLSYKEIMAHHDYSLRGEYARKFRAELDEKRKNFWSKK